MDIYSNFKMYYENLQRRYFWILRNILRLLHFFKLYISYHVLEMYKSKVRQIPYKNT